MRGLIKLVKAAEIRARAEKRSRQPQVQLNKNEDEKGKRIQAHDPNKARAM
jgi:hypothetical protein